MPKNQFVFFAAALLIGYNCCKAQTTCDTLQQNLQYLNQTLQLNRLERVPAKRKELYQTYITSSLKAAVIARRCFAKAPAPPGSIAQLKNNYLLGKLLYQSGNCAKAHTLFKNCLSNPNCGTLKLNNAGTYTQFINKAFGTCSNYERSEAVNANGYVYEYDGKGGAFIKDMFSRMDTIYFDDTPLSPNEIEAVAARTVHGIDTINADLALQLSGSSDYLLAPPFLLLHGKNEFAAIPVKWEKNLAFNKPIAVPAPTLNTFSLFINKQYQVFKAAYFDKFKAGGKLITVYLNGGSYDEKGLEGYLDFCKAIHYKATKRVAYYMPFDNSIVAWTSSGGGTLVHEIIHALVAGDQPRAPLWLNEGLASLYEEADSTGKPLNNYRLIFIQQAFIKKNTCISWADLLAMEKYAAASEMNYNLLSAYSRHFCKFLYDEFGNELLAHIYKTIRDSAVTTPAKQVKLICSNTGKTTDELQKQWQDYLLNEPIPERWQKLTAGISTAFKSKEEFVFKHSTIAPDLEAVQKAAVLHIKYSELKKQGGTLSNSFGPEQN